MPPAWPPMKTSTRDQNGSQKEGTAAPNNVIDNSGVIPNEYAPPTGRTPICTPTTNSRMIANANGGTLEKKREPTKAPRSNQPPLNAATAPRMLPRIQPTMMAGSISAMLQGSAWPISELTDAGYWPNEVPKSPCNTCP